MSSGQSILSSLRAEPDQSPLLAIPPEIRNMIYNYTFSVDHIQAIRHRPAANRKENNQHKDYQDGRVYTMTFETRDPDTWRTVPQQLSSHLALAKTCRHLRAEIKHLPFSCNIFDMRITSVRHFCAVVPKDILRNIKILSLWKYPRYRREVTETGDPVEYSDHDGTLKWGLYLAPLRKTMPALEKVIVRIRTDARALRYHSRIYGTELKEVVHRAVNRAAGKEVELELV
jgi:hypothetical protein